MKKLIFALLALIMVISLVLGGCTSKDADYVINESEVITMGVILPLSGENADLGQKIVSGIEYAASLASIVNIYSEHQIELIIKDSAQDISTSAKEMLDENVCAVICYGGNKETTDAIISSFSAENTPLVFIDNYSDMIAKAENVFSISSGYNYQCSVATTYLIGEGYKSGAVVCASDDDYFKTFAQMFDNTFVNNGGQAVSTYYYSGEEANFSPKAITDGNQDFIFIIGNNKDTKAIYSELSDVGISSQILFSEVFDKTEFKDEFYNNISFLSKIEKDDNNYIGSDFINNYSEDNKLSIDDITSATAYGYDAYMVIYDVLRNFNPATQSLNVSTTEPASEDTTESISVYASQVAEGIKNVEHYGVTDTITFTDNGTAVSSYIYVDRVENAQPYMLSRYDYNNG